MEAAKYVYMVIDFSSDTAPAKVAGIYSTREQANQRREDLRNEPVPVEFLRRNYGVYKVRLDQSMDWII